MDYQAAAIVLWHSDGNRKRFSDTDETTRDFYLDRAHAIIEAAVGDEVLLRRDDSCRWSKTAHITGCFKQFYPEVKE